MRGQGRGDVRRGDEEETGKQRVRILIYANSSAGVR